MSGGSRGDPPQGRRGDLLRGEFERIVAVGEGMNDVPMFEAADLRVAYGGVHVPNRVLTGLSDFVVHEGEALCRLLNML